MSDIFLFAFLTAWMYIISLFIVHYALSKSKETCIFLLCLVTIVFSLINAWLININLNKIPVDSVEKSWKAYTTYCKEEHLSWSEFTYPEWLSIQASY